MRIARTTGACVLLILGVSEAQAFWLWGKKSSEQQPYGIAKRAGSPAYLRMPKTSDGDMPPLLSQTGVFKDLRTLTPNRGILPYDLVVPFWSDGARKQRLAAIPRGKKVGFSAKGEWTFPEGTVFVKTFTLPIDDASPGLGRRLETRLLVRDSAGGVYGVVYKWRADGSDADLLTASVTETVPVKSANGTVHDQTWYYPSREDCMKCHTSAAGGVLGMKTRQMNRAIIYPNGIKDNQLRAWNHAKMFNTKLDESTISGLDKLAASDDSSRSLEDRARSYLDANCSQCHRPGGVVANFDARYDTPLTDQQLINGQVLFDQGIDRAHVITPHDVWRSVALMRISTNDDIRMPPVARQTIDQHGVALLSAWIQSLPGRDVLQPPEVLPAGGHFPGPTLVTLKASEPGVEIHYTLDGSNPDTSDPVYKKPIKISAPTVLRARAFKEGWTRSIPVEQIFIVGK